MKRVLITAGKTLFFAGIMAGILWVMFGPHPPCPKPRGPYTMAKLKDLTLHIRHYCMDNGDFPEGDDIEDLTEALFSWDPPLAEIYNHPKLTKDGWGNQFCYRYPGKVYPKSFDLYSFGPNGRDEMCAGDDLDAWKIVGEPPLSAEEILRRRNSKSAQ